MKFLGLLIVTCLLAVTLAVPTFDFKDVFDRIRQEAAQKASDEASVKKEEKQEQLEMQLKSMLAQDELNYMEMEMRLNAVKSLGLSYPEIERLQSNTEQPSHSELRFLLLQQQYNSMNQRMERIHFLLLLLLTPGTYTMPPMTAQQMHLQELVAHALSGTRSRANEEWMLLQDLLLKRYRAGDATLAETIVEYLYAESKANSMPVVHFEEQMEKIKQLQMMFENMNQTNNSFVGDMSVAKKMEMLVNIRKSLTQKQSNDEFWLLFKRCYGKSYPQPLEEARKKIFEEKVTMIVAHNIEARLGMHSFSLGINNLTDRTVAEMAKLRGYRSPQSSTQRRMKRQAPSMPTYTSTVAISSLPATVNWTAQGWVGPVLDQGECGSCYAFGAAGALEAQYFNKTKTYVQLSEQNIVDCTVYLGNNECNGGAFQYAFEYVMDVGIDSLVSYPYTGVNGTCTYLASNSVTIDNGYWNIQENSETALQQAVALVGPVTVGIDASLPSFQLYKSGVYAPSACSALLIDHAVLVVGYGTTSSGQDYWLIKNSWGTTWGIEGYMMMARNDGNMCGIASDAGFPIIN